jgi:hypothetical protein
MHQLAVSNRRFGSRVCENSARYNRAQNFEACRHAQSKKNQKFVLRSTLRPDQISFSHSLGHFLPPGFVAGGGSCFPETGRRGGWSWPRPRAKAVMSTAAQDL